MLPGYLVFAGISCAEAKAGQNKTAYLHAEAIIASNECFQGRRYKVADITGCLTAFRERSGRQAFPSVIALGLSVAQIILLLQGFRSMRAVAGLC